MLKHALLLLALCAVADASYYGGYYSSDSCASWSECIEWEHEFPLTTGSRSLFGDAMPYSHETVTKYAQQTLTPDGRCQFGVTSDDARESKACRVYGCGATYHRCRCVTEGEAEAAKARKKRALKISGWVFWGFGMIICLIVTKMCFSNPSHATEEGAAMTISCGMVFCVMLGFILLACGYYAVNLDGYWRGCGQKNDSPDYFFHYQFLESQSEDNFREANPDVFSTEALASAGVDFADWKACHDCVNTICAPAQMEKDPVSYIQMCYNTTHGHCTSLLETCPATIASIEAAVAKTDPDGGSGVAAYGDSVDNTPQSLSDLFGTQANIATNPDEKKEGGIVLGLGITLCIILPLLGACLGKLCDHGVHYRPSESRTERHHSNFDHNKYNNMDFSVHTGSSTI